MHFQGRIVHDLNALRRVELQAPGKHALDRLLVSWIRQKREAVDGRFEERFDLLRALFDETPRRNEYRVEVRGIGFGHIEHYGKTLFFCRLSKTRLQWRRIDPAGRERRDSIRLGSHLHDGDLVPGGIQAERVQRYFSRQVTARAKGADRNSLAFQIRGLAHLRQNPKLIREDMDRSRQNHKVGSARNCARRRTNAGGSQLRLAGDQRL